MKMRKALAIILTAIMMCTIAPAQVFAEEGTVFTEDGPAFAEDGDAYAPEEEQKAEVPEEVIPSDEVQPDELQGIKEDGNEEGNPGEADPEEPDPDVPQGWVPEEGPLPKVKKLALTILNSSQILVTWRASEDYDGYQVQYAKNVLFLRSKKKTLKGSKINNLTLNGLKTSKRYYVRIRAFRKYDGRTYRSEWVRVKTDKACADASISFAKRGSKKVDIRRQAGKKLSGYTVTQGTCSSGKYLFMAFEKRNGDDDGKKRARIKIAKVRISDWKLVKVSPKGQKLGHANDITYNPYKKYLVVTGAKTYDRHVRIVSTKTLKKIDTVRIRLGSKHSDVNAFNAIDFNTEDRTYLLRSRYGGSKTFILNENFKVQGYHIYQTAWPNRFVQSCTIYAGQFILTQSLNQTAKANTITIFDQNGNRLQNIRLKMKGELESVFMIGKKLYATMHKWIGGYCTGYIFQILL
ncbi:MAG: fibronectin type III domain-containing protein [Firmicutes bacterium]|nr:fibronectin type III domain-containing protein [Bacillota bacterium]